MAMEYSFPTEVILTMFTRLHNYYGLMENADIEKHTWFLCFAILLTLLVELYNLNVGGCLKII